MYCNQCEPTIKGRDHFVDPLAQGVQRHPARPVHAGISDGQRPEGVG